MLALGDMRPSQAEWPFQHKLAMLEAFKASAVTGCVSTGIRLEGTQKKQGLPAAGRRSRDVSSLHMLWSTGFSLSCRRTVETKDTRSFSWPGAGREVMLRMKPFEMGGHARPQSLSAIGRTSASSITKNPICALAMAYWCRSAEQLTCLRHVDF